MVDSQGTNAHPPTDVRQLTSRVVSCVALCGQRMLVGCLSLGFTLGLRYALRGRTAANASLSRPGRGDAPYNTQYVYRLAVVMLHRIQDRPIRSMRCLLPRDF